MFYIFRHNILRPFIVLYCYLSPFIVTVPWDTGGTFDHKNQQQSTTLNCRMNWLSICFICYLVFWGVVEFCLKGTHNVLVGGSSPSSPTISKAYTTFRKTKIPLGTLVGHFKVTFSNNKQHSAISPL